MALTLAGDIGGTKTLLALFKTGQGSEPLFLMSFQSRQFSDLASIVRLYLERVKHNEQIDKAVFAIAGPVFDQTVKATNLPWQVDGEKLRQELGLKSVWLLNDLEASAYSLEVLDKKSLCPLTKISKETKGNRVVVSPGTGLGEAGIYFDGKAYHPFATEGGHADFAPDDELQLGLLRYLKSRFGHVSYERIVSGSGFQLLLDFFIKEKKRAVETKIADEMVDNDVSAVITRHAELRDSDLCVEIVDLFVTILGQEASNAALKLQAVGGVFLGGGIPAKILPCLQGEAFIKGFFNKGRFNAFLEKVPIFVILDPLSSLKGAIFASESHYS